MGLRPILSFYQGVAEAGGSSAQLTGGRKGFPRPRSAVLPACPTRPGRYPSRQSPSPAVPDARRPLPRLSSWKPPGPAGRAAAESCGREAPRCAAQAEAGPGLTGSGGEEEGRRGRARRARGSCARSGSPRARATRGTEHPGTRRPRAGAAMTMLERRALESPPGRSLGLQPRGGKWGGAGKVEY